MAKGFRDLVSFHWGKSPMWMKKREMFWNPELSWRNKYKYRNLSDRLRSDIRPELTFLGKYATGLTDGWHMLELILKICVIFGAITYGLLGIYFDTPIIRLTLDPLLLYLAFQGGFKLTYK